MLQGLTLVDALSGGSRDAREAGLAVRGMQAAGRRRGMGGSPMTRLLPLQSHLGKPAQEIAETTIQAAHPLTGEKTPGNPSPHHLSQ